jgi:hypothetical protein
MFKDGAMSLRTRAAAMGVALAAVPVPFHATWFPPDSTFGHVVQSQYIVAGAGGQTGSVGQVTPNETLIVDDHGGQIIVAAISERKMPGLYQSFAGPKSKAWHHIRIAGHNAITTTSHEGANVSIDVYEQWPGYTINATGTNVPSSDFFRFLGSLRYRR